MAASPGKSLFGKTLSCAVSVVKLCSRRSHYKLCTKRDKCFMDTNGPFGKLENITIYILLHPCILGNRGGLKVITPSHKPIFMYFLIDITCIQYTCMGRSNIITQHSF